MNKYDFSKLSKTNLKRYFGDYHILTGYKRYTLREGKANGVDVTEIRTGSGLTLEVLESRGMDIGRVYYNNIPVSYRSYNKEANPVYYEYFGDSWLRGFSGGLLVTAGLKNIGINEIDGNEVLPLHGRISHIPAEDVRIDEIWKDNDLYYQIRGKVRESKSLNYNFTLERTITVKAFEDIISIHDEITNEGFKDEEFQLLYHINLGYPIISENSHLYCESKSVEPRDNVAKERTEPYNDYLAPTPNYPDVVYYHDIEADENGVAKVSVINKKMKFGVQLSYNKKMLDQFTEWKYTGEGDYVAGIEPCNCRVNGRMEERRENRLKIIKAQESLSYDLQIKLLTDEKEIEKIMEGRK